jgi:hypothetical protein
MRATERRLGASILTAAATVAVLAGAERAVAQEAETGSGEQARLLIANQGARAFGGRIVGDLATAALHCDHGYVEWQVPVDARDVPLLMWHSSSTKTWETTFDRRWGFKNIFLHRGFPVYLIDGPRIGRADWGCEEYTYTPDTTGRAARTISSFRLGTWNPPDPPEFFPNVQFATDDESALNQLFRGRYLEFETIPNAQLETDEVAKLVNAIGPVTIISHSGSGIRGWLTRLKSDKVAGIVAYEPVGFVFPAGELPAGDLGFDVEVPLAEFEALTEIPIQVVFGDNLDKVELWASVFPRAQAFVEAVNNHGGDAQLLHLPDIGIFGNTHFPMSDLNNRQVADLLMQFLREKGLAKRSEGQSAVARIEWEEKR